MVWYLLQTEDDRAHDVAAAAALLPGVVTAAEVTGSYDVIVQATASVPEPRMPGRSAGSERVLRQLQTMPGVSRTLTLTTTSCQDRNLQPAS
jgi:hypothetical protein